MVTMIVLWLRFFRIDLLSWYTHRSGWWVGVKDILVLRLLISVLSLLFTFTLRFKLNNV